MYSSVYITEFLSPYSRTYKPYRSISPFSSVSFCLMYLPKFSQQYAAAAKSLQSCPTLCDPMDGSPPGSPIPGILQARILVAISFSNTWKVKSESEVAQSCPTLSDLMDCSLLGSSFHGSFQARVLEWVATASSILAIYVYAFMSSSWWVDPLIIMKYPSIHLKSILSDVNIATPPF